MFENQHFFLNIDNKFLASKPTSIQNYYLLLDLEIINLIYYFAMKFIYKYMLVKIHNTLKSKMTYDLGFEGIEKGEG